MMSLLLSSPVSTILQGLPVPSPSCVGLSRHAAWAGGGSGHRALGTGGPQPPRTPQLLTPAAGGGAGLPQPGNEKEPKGAWMLWGSHQPPTAEEQLSPPWGCTEPEPQAGSARPPATSLRLGLPPGLLPLRPGGSHGLCPPAAAARPAGVGRCAPSSANIAAVRMPSSLRVRGKTKGWFAYREP